MALILVFSLSVIISCSDEHGDQPSAFYFDAPEMPTGLTVTPGSNQAVLEWSYPAESIDQVSEFRIYYYYELYDLEELIGTSTGTSFTDSDLIGNMVYCYRVSAVNLDDKEGERTAAVCEMVDP